MKKISSLIAITLLLGVFVSCSFAEDVLSDADAGSTATQKGELNIGSAGTSEVLNIGLSPKVVARYVNPGTTEALGQWFAIATGYSGGNMIYATAQDLNNIYKKDYATGTTVDKTILNVSVTKASAEVWISNKWEL